MGAKKYRDLDIKHKDMLDNMLMERERLKTPSVGDCVMHDKLGILRIAVIHESSGEFQCGKMNECSFNLSEGGECDSSGARMLDLHQMNNLKDLGVTTPSNFKIWLDGRVGEGRLIEVLGVPTKTWILP